ncbi:N-alpha-acetyltransferas-like protein 15 [Westerdykella ornata]|uniref:N-alpha-acetyltransferas-like protein 15 n=1 Tax=Westerdykella ornata TaxID=318751 RepID=A0A6A6JX48_WESOR|nr:N-alpha-acetyltransferas-like protein 15 [Westerdykella ornata]KAF2279639.1 N-alpha-acetyltransferas-like protein 15 [Westerdykella ornata]
MPSDPMQPLSSKENSLFRQVVKCYEDKHYKKGLKAADQILRAHPNHGDTQAMKALILNSTGKGDEAFTLCKEALKNNMKSHITWHVYGLLYRSVKNYEEAIKAYKFALRLEPEQANILRDLALLQIQMRDYKGYLDSRTKMLSQRPALRQNWTGVAIAHHLLNNYQAAEKILTTYEETLKQKPSKSDIEHSEAGLYKISIIAESGDKERALKELERILKDTLDRASALEMRAELLLELGRKEDAEKAYRTLLDRNNERRAYYEGLEKALGLDRSDPSAHSQLMELYNSYAAKSQRVDAARRIPLDFLTGDDFRQATDRYLQQMFKKGVPSTFNNIKALYADPAKKAVIEELVLGYASGTSMNGSANGETNGTSDRFEESVLYFLAQHYNYHLSRDLQKAMEYIDKLIERNPKSVDYNQTKARIFKHYGNITKAAETINHARELDLKDRYINTKCAKYQLRNNENDVALNTMSKFTRNEATGGPLGDLHDMQCLWYLTEDGEAYLRQRNLGLALKRFTAVADIFDIWQEDQFDFHAFSLRKGQIRAYIDMIRWEDHLREHPFFTRAALSAINIYLQLADNQGLSNGTEAAASQQDATERKKAQKKAKKELEKLAKQEAEKKAKKANPPKDDGETKKEDTDPNGLKLLETKEPLEAALRFLTPLLEFSPKNIDAQNIGFEVHFRRKKYLLALKCLNAARAIDPENPKLHEQAIRFRQAMNETKDLPDTVAKAIEETFDIVPADADLKAYNSEWRQKHADSPAHQQSALNVQYLLDNRTKGECEADLKKLLESASITMEQAANGLEYLDEWKSDATARNEYRSAASQKWPQATVFLQ